MIRPFFKVTIAHKMNMYSHCHLLHMGGWGFKLIIHA